MKKITRYILFAITSIPFGLSGQEKIGESQTSLSANFYTDSLQNQRRIFARKSAYYLSLLPDQMSMARGAFSFERGNFIPSQGATKIRSGQLYTEGTTKLKSVKVFGSFQYRKIFEDSTRFAHQTRNNFTTPYYFGSPGYVHYERSIYNITAMASQSILQNRLTFALGSNYNVANHFSTNDPRGAVNEYQLDINASVGYQLSREIKIGLGYRPGYGREDINVAYKNPRYYESSSFPMYYNHLINGYGEGRPVLAGPDRKYFNNFKRQGADLYLDFSNHVLGEINLYGSYIKENQRYFQTSGTGFKYFSNYDLEKMNVALRWLKSLNKNTRVGANLVYEKLDGRDQNLEFSANNYIYAGQRINAKILFNTTANKNSFNYYINALQFSQERIDGIRGNDVSYNNLLLEIGSSVKRNQSNKNFFGANISTSYKMPMGNRFTVAQANEGYFTRYVIYHDYLYNTSSYIGGAVSGEYGFSVFKDMIASLQINATYMKKLEQQNLTRTIISEPGKHRFSSNISLNLYF
ncbi:hypothetical protein OQZ33_19120 [Pedobacter sp. MC2016-05]|uniref:DUF6850 family outer membrane beta-barrel protein n=1 Tax=Pedobacter sp. MC2016-05 TaxID=2994474 RepID=UPI002245EA71|nr:DUF6850 family outer membrane beta-barrel protein [Pedobacter sp. MC2016-05]MCX2476454.1 hypothetical protein [Pedobacter sp. MC2016-05]